MKAHHTTADSTDCERQRGRRFTRDDRGVSALLGGILLFALVIALVALIQVNAVPAANEQVEFEHNQRVQGDMQELQESQYRVASTGTEATVKIETGTGYPQRFLLLNPSRPSGSLRTEAIGTVGIDNANATGETGDYWNGASRSFSASSLTYQAYYNEYANAPETVVEHGGLYNSHANGRTTVIERGALVSGRDISIVLLQGNLSTTNDRAVTVSVTPVSAPAQTITVSDDGAPINLTIPTRRSVEDWNDSLADENVSQGGHVQRVSAGPLPNTVNVTLQRNVTYSLRIAAVGVGSGYETTPEAVYIVDSAGNGTTVPEGGTQRLVAQVRDEYNNPVVNETVGVTASNGTVSFVGTNQTDADGEVTIAYEAPTSVSSLRAETVVASIGGNATEQERVRFEVSVFDADGSGAGTTGSGGGNPINPGQNVVLRGAELVNPGKGNCEARNSDCVVVATFENTDSASAPTVAEMRVSFYSTFDDTEAPRTVVVSDEGTTGTKRLTLGADFTTVPLDDFGVAGSAADEQVYRFAFEDFLVQNTFRDGAVAGDFFVVEIIYADGGNRNVVTYFVPPREGP